MERRVFSMILMLLLCGTLMLLCGGLLSCNREEPSPELPEEDTLPSGEEVEPQPEENPEPEAKPVYPSERYAQKQESITDYLLVHGRSPVVDGKLQLYWTNSGFSFYFYGTGVTAKLKPSSTNPTYYGYLKVFIDGEFSPAATVCVNKTGTFTLVEGLTEGEHLIEVRKRNEAIYGESATIAVEELSVIDGGFRKKAPTKSKYVIEFIGDSITGGFGNMISDNSGNFTTATQDGTRTYATLTAKALGVEATVLSRSGICYVTGSNRDSMYPFYIQTAALPGRSASVDYWDFESNLVDVVVINLGTNDTGASINGNAISAQQYTEHAVEFIKLVRANNPYAVIVWAYGMMTQSRGDCIEAAVKQVNDEGDYDVFYVSLPTLNAGKEGVGTHGHPSYLSHLSSAKVLTEFLAEEMGWEYDRSIMLQAMAEFAEDYMLSNTEGYVAASLEPMRRALKEARELTARGGTDEEYAAAEQAILDARARMASEADYSDEYIVLEACDEKGSWSLNGQKNVGIDTENAIVGEGCFTTTGNGWINFMNTSGSIEVAMPDDWQSWYLEMWIYLDDPSALPNGCNIELSQTVDKVEFSWDIKGLGLQSGWNYVQLPISRSVRAGAAEFTALKNIRIFLINLPSQVTFKVDDIVLSRGKYALYVDELSALIDQAEALNPEDDSDLGVALSRAKDALSQRQVDNAIEALKAILN